MTHPHTISNCPQLSLVISFCKPKSLYTTISSHSLAKTQHRIAANMLTSFLLIQIMSLCTAATQISVPDYKNISNCWPKYDKKVPPPSWSHGSRSPTQVNILILKADRSRLTLVCRIHARHNQTLIIQTTTTSTNSSRCDSVPWPCAAEIQRRILQFVKHGHTADEIILHSFVSLTTLINII